MIAANAFLVLLFLLTIGHLLTLKVCSATLDHRTTPAFIGIWTLLGAAVAWPHFSPLWTEGWDKMAASPWLPLLGIIKGVVLCFLFVVSQELMKESLSSRHYVTPMSVGLMTIVNGALGERLTVHQLLPALGLCALATGFFFKGHLADLSRRGRVIYIQLVLLTAVLAGIDQFLIKNTNWYAALIVTNAAMLAVALWLNRRQVSVLWGTLLHKSAALAGFFYAATELVKQYQMITINPVTVVVTVQAATKPIILVLAALLWKERTVREQTAWGVIAFAIMLPLFFKG